MIIDLIILNLLGFLMYLATLSMTMYTHQTPCKQGNLTLTEGMSANHGVSEGPAFDPVTLMPLISTMVILFGEFSCILANDHKTLNCDILKYPFRVITIIMNTNIVNIHSISRA